MRRLFRRLGARTGISLGLIAVIAVVLIVARLIDDRSANNPFPHSPEYSPVVMDTMGDDSVEEEPTAYPDDETVLDVAAEFATAWLRPDLSAQEWLDGLRPLATPELIDLLTDVDPSEVPAGATAGEPTIRDRTEGHAIVLIRIAPHDALALGLAATDDGWRVATVDRETG